MLNKPFITCLLISMTMSIVTVVDASNTVFRVIAKTTDAPATAFWYDIPSINRSGEIAFSALVRSGGNNFIRSGKPGAMQDLVVLGQSIPGYTTLHGPFNNATIDDTGTVAFYANVSDEDGFWTSKQGLFASNAAEGLRVMAMESEPVPGLPDAIFSLANQYGQLLGSRSGRWSYLINTPGGGNSFSILQNPGSLLVAQGLPAPSLDPAGNFVNLYFSDQQGDRRMAGNGHSDFIFSADVRSFGTKSLWMHDETGLHMLRIEGDPLPAPLSDWTMFEFIWLGINTNKQLCIVGRTQFQNTNILSDAIVAGSHTNLQIIAQKDAPAPGMTNLVNFSSLQSEKPYMNDQNEVIFQAFMDTPSNRIGIWAGTPGNLQLLVREGQPAPGLPDGVIHDFSVEYREPIINDAGHICFIQEVAGPGIDDSNNQVLWAGLPGFLRPIVRSGDLINLGGGDIRSVQFISMHPGAGHDGRPAGMNDAGQLVLRLQFHSNVGLGGAAIMFVDDLLDADADDISVIFEAWMGMAEHESRSDILPMIVRNADAINLLYRCAINPPPGNLTVQYSSDLHTWVEAAGTTSLASDQTNLPAGVKRLQFTPAQATMGNYRLAITL